jgi:hypothetical protein
MFKEAKVLSIILIIGLLAALFVLAGRYSAEQQNRAVELVIDYTEATQLAAAAGQPVESVLRKFENAGATSVAVEVETVGTLLDSGRAQLYPTGNHVTLVAGSAEFRERLLRALDNYFSRSENVGYPLRFDGASLRVDTAYLRSIPVGLAPDAVKNARTTGMAVVARMTNYPGIDEATVRKTLESVAADGARTVIFGGDQVLGFRGLVDVTGEVFDEQKLAYGSIEFGRQKGDAGLSRRLEDRMVRVHSIPQAEMAQLSESSAIERYTRAARERNIRLQYVRLFDGAAEDPLAVNAEYVGKIASSLRRYGFEPKQAHSFANSAPAPWLLALIGAGVAAGVGLLISSVVTLSARAVAIWLVIGVVVLGGLSAAPMALGQKLVALLAALTFPTLAMIRAGRGSPGSVTKGAGAGSASVKFLSAVATSAVGGLLIAALLSSRSFMLKIDQFAGVKLAHLVPLLLVLAVYAAGLAWQRGTWTEQKKRASDALRSLFSQPILIWQAVGLLVVLVLIALVLARSGNEPGVGVSSIELRARAILDQIFYVRPRTKELLFGHPLFFLGIALAVTGRRSWAVPFIVLGTIGQVSLLNTFCHIHTPIFLSILRVAIGAVLGLAVGLVLYWVVRRTGIIRTEESP